MKKLLISLIITIPLLSCSKDENSLPSNSQEEQIIEEFIEFQQVCNNIDSMILPDRYIVYQVDNSPTVVYTDEEVGFNPGLAFYTEPTDDIVFWIVHREPDLNIPKDYVRFRFKDANENEGASTINGNDQMIYLVTSYDNETGAEMIFFGTYYFGSNIPKEICGKVRVRFD